MDFCEGKGGTFRGVLGLKLTAQFAENEGVWVRFLGYVAYICGP